MATNWFSYLGVIGAIAALFPWKKYGINMPDSIEHILHNVGWSFLIVWGCAFICYLLHAPAKLYYEQKYEDVEMKRNLHQRMREINGLIPSVIFFLLLQV